jgi:hypothetical protein
MIKTISKSWFNQYGIPREIHFKKGKVDVSQLTQKINQLSLPAATTTVQGKSQITTFNTEIECQWELAQTHIPEDNFVNAINFFHKLQNPIPKTAHRPPQQRPGTEEEKLIYKLDKEDHNGTDEEDGIPEEEDESQYNN